MVTGRVKFGENLTEIPELMLITPSDPRPLDSISNCDKRVVQMCFLLGLNVCFFQFSFRVPLQCFKKI